LFTPKKRIKPISFTLWQSSLSEAKDVSDLA
jgi:hypothetical protein